MPDSLSSIVSCLSDKSLFMGDRIKKGDDFLNEELVKEKFKRTDERLKDHGKRLNDLEKSDAINQVEIKHLCKAINRQIRVMYFLAGTIIAAFVGFFFYALQSRIFY